MCRQDRQRWQALRQQDGAVEMTGYLAVVTRILAVRCRGEFFRCLFRTAAALVNCLFSLLGLRFRGVIQPMTGQPQPGRGLHRQPQAQQCHEQGMRSR